MTWRIIHITNVDKLSLNTNNLQIKKVDTEVTIPLGDIYALIIEDLKISLTTRLLVELSYYNILVLFCNQKHLPECILTPVSGHFNQYAQTSKQLEWNENRKDKLWELLIKQKIHNHNYILKNNGAEAVRISKMNDLAESVYLQDVENIEGQAARYFYNTFYTDFTRDNDELIENAVLNYGFSILHSAIARTIVAKGLIPAIGVHHVGARNHFNLASDLIEPFRPLVDLLQITDPPPEGYLTREYRIKLINLMHARVTIDNKRHTVIRAIEIMVQSIIDYFEDGKEEKLKLPTLDNYEFYEL